MCWAGVSWIGRPARVGRLYVVPTPIGNLEDVTLRALRVLREAEVIFAEDTRHTRRLLNHYEIPNRLVSYHQHNKVGRLEEALHLLGSADIALVSDAGTPSVADPGFELVEAAVASGVEVDVLPGASAVITALVGAAMPAPGFLFLGFLPRRSNERLRRLAEVADLPFSLVLYEAPHRLLPTLQDLSAVLGDRRAVLARELTKVHQEYVRATLPELCVRYDGRTVRGECTLVVAGAARVTTEQSAERAVRDLWSRRQAGAARRDAVREVMAAHSIGRNALYRQWLQWDREEQ